MDKISVYTSKGEKVTIEYSDGTKINLDTYGLVGFPADTWHKVLLSPAETADQITLNNMLVEISETLIQTIHEQMQSESKPL